MNIKKDHFKMIRYLDKDMKEINIPDEDMYNGPPDPKKYPGIIYQSSCFPSEVRTKYLQLKPLAHNLACKHPSDQVTVDDVYTDSHYELVCHKCKHKQRVSSIRIDGELVVDPNGWIFPGSLDVLSEGCSGPADLPEAIIKSGDYSLDEALILSRNSCERCLNVLIYKYMGTTGRLLKSDGYPEYSIKWKNAQTSCQFCEDN